MLALRANHSLRASAATRLFEAGVDEQLIIQRTGHSSCAGICSYKRVGEKLHALTSDVLNACDSKPNEKPVCNSKPVEKCCSSQANTAANTISFDTKENIPSTGHCQLSALRCM